MCDLPITLASIDFREVAPSHENGHDSERSANDHRENAEREYEGSSIGFHGQFQIERFCVGLRVTGDPEPTLRCSTGSAYRFFRTQRNFRASTARIWTFHRASLIRSLSRSGRVQLAFEYRFAPRPRRRPDPDVFVLVLPPRIKS